MSLIHLHNEVVQQRTLAAKSWSTYISFGLDEATDEIVAETIAIYHDADRPAESYRKSRGQLRISRDHAPPALARELEWIEGFQGRDTTVLQNSDTTVFGKLTRGASGMSPTGLLSAGLDDPRRTCAT